MNSKSELRRIHLQKLAAGAFNVTREPYSDLSRAKEFTDERIAADVAADPDAAPILDEWSDDAVVVIPQKKIPISLRIDQNTLDFFKQHGKGYLTLINAVLHAYAQHHRKIARK